MGALSRGIGVLVRTRERSTWFGADPTTDRYVARLGRLGGSRRRPARRLGDHAIALEVLLDQFSLQQHRKQRQGYEQSAPALPIAERHRPRIRPAA